MHLVPYRAHARTGPHRSRWAAIGAAVAVTLGGGGLLTTSASIGTGERGVYVPIAPCRLFDTRPAPDNVGPRNTPLGPGDTYTATVLGTNGNCTIPTDAVGLTMNVAIINPSSASFLTVYPADVARPLAANANWIANQPPLSNAVTADISADGKIAFYNLAGTVNIAADIVGYYIDHNHDDRYYTKPQIDAAFATVNAPPQGATRVALDTAGPVGLNSSIAIGTDGYPVIAYYDNTVGDLKVAKCTSRSCSGVPAITTLDATGVVGSYASIGIGANGNPVIAYFDNTNGDLKVAKCLNPACTGTPTITTLDATGNVGYYSSLVVGVDGNPVVAYFDNTTSDLKVAKCVNPECTGAPTITSVDTTGSVGHFSTIEIGADGNPVIAYYDNTNFDLKTAKCLNPACTGASTITTVDSVGDVGYYPSVAIGSDGLPLIAYYDNTNFDLKVAHCVTTACTGVPVLNVIESTGNVGEIASVALTADGIPVMSYYDSGNFDLRYARCGNATCAGVSAVTAVDSVGDSGYGGSLAIGADGLPIMSYYDATNGDLRIAKCASLSCIP